MKTSDLLRHIDAAHVRVEALDPDTARIAALASYNRLHASEPGFRPASPSAHNAFAQRVTVNHLRHHHTEYDKTLRTIASEVGRAQAYALLKNKVLSAIAHQYPDLAPECQRQRVNVPELLRQLGQQ